MRTRMSSFGPVSPIPANRVTHEDGLWLARRTTESGGSVKVKVLVRNEIFDKAVTENVVAEIKGLEKPEETVILGAHLDTWFLELGAADNSLGVSIVMETARILSHSDLAPPRPPGLSCSAEKSRGCWTFRVCPSPRKGTRSNRLNDEPRHGGLDVSEGAQSLWSQSHRGRDPRGAAGPRGARGSRI